MLISSIMDNDSFTFGEYRKLQRLALKIFNIDYRAKRCFKIIQIQNNCILELLSYWVSYMIYMCPGLYNFTNLKLTQSKNIHLISDLFVICYKFNV